MVTIIPLQTMPALLPVDYSIGGEVRRWGSKYSYLILPMVTLLITLLWQFLVAHFERRAVGDDKEAQGAAANAKVLVSVGLVMNLFSACCRPGCCGLRPGPQSISELREERRRGRALRKRRRKRCVF